MNGQFLNAASPDRPLSMSEPRDLFLTRCVSIDLEVDPRTARIFSLAAVWYGTSQALISRGSSIEPVLDQLEAELSHTDHLIGHNILRHDLPHLAAVRPRLADLARAPIDTLWLNPLAFPRNPYHHLVKHITMGVSKPGM